MAVALERVVGATPQRQYGPLEIADAGVEKDCTHVGQVGTGRNGQVVGRLMGVVEAGYYCEPAVGHPSFAYGHGG